MESNMHADQKRLLEIQHILRSDTDLIDREKIRDFQDEYYELSRSRLKRVFRFIALSKYSTLGADFKNLSLQINDYLCGPSYDILRFENGEDILMVSPGALVYESDETLVQEILNEYYGDQLYRALSLVGKASITLCWHLPFQTPYLMLFRKLHRTRESLVEREFEMLVK